MAADDGRHLTDLGRRWLIATDRETSAMFSSEARIESKRPERYLAQICKHAAAIGTGGHRARMHAGDPDARDAPDVRAEWSDTQGAITFTPWGTCALTARGAMLTLRVEATDVESLRRIQDILTRDLDRFGRRDRLAVTWQDPQG